MNRARSAKLGDERLAALGVAAVNHHAAAFGHDAPRDRFADAGRAAGDQDDFILESHG